MRCLQGLWWWRVNTLEAMFYGGDGDECFRQRRWLIRSGGNRMLEMELGLGFLH